MVTYSIIIPIVPFVIDAIDRGVSPEETIADSYYGSSYSYFSSAAKKTGFLLAAYAVGMIFGSLIIGYLADVLKQKRILMLGGFVCLLLSTLLFMQSRDIWLLLFSRLMQGISNACVWTLGGSLVVDRFPIEELGKQMGIVSVFHFVGMLSGPAIGVALYYTRGYKAPFIFCISLAVVDFVMRLFLIERKHSPSEWYEEEDQQEIKRNLDAQEGSILSIAHTTSNKDHKLQVTYFVLLKQPRLINGLLLNVSYALLTGVLESIFSTRLASEWNYDSRQIGLLYSATVIPNFISTTVAGIFADRYGPKVIIYPFWLLCIVTVALTGVPNKDMNSGAIPFVVLAGFSTFCASAFVAPTFSEIAYVVRSQNAEGEDDGTSRSYALINIAFASGFIIGSLLGGYLYTTIGVMWLHILLGAIFLTFTPFVFMFTGERGKFIVRSNQEK
ncbi:MFS general substrate transporter [Rhizopus microsporus]|uniref:MFS general substrate transporter n=2 Tax=Rhizopus TaxID=4842 RepID=A0A1X0SCE7_RHIZD|nr:MFS general substrate transporter [Rhizopus microsporus]